MSPASVQTRLAFLLIACAYACAGGPALGQSTQPPLQAPNQSPPHQDPAEHETQNRTTDQAPTQGPPDTVEPPEKKGFFSRFVDEQDGKVDFSNFLAKGGFIPVPIIITEPVVEGGFGLAAAFLTVPKDNPQRVNRRFVAAFKTGNGSTGGGYFESGYAFDGRLNYRVGIGRGNFTLEAFPAFAPQGIKYTNHYKYGILGSALWSIGDDGWSVGPVIDFRKLSSGLEIADLPEDFTSDFNNTLKTGALGLGLHFDSRDNQLTPTNGLNAYFEGKLNRDAFGSDREYEDYDAHFYGFARLAPTLRGSLKLELDGIRGDYPAYFAPAITLRGVQAIRYQGQNVLSSEGELALELNKRWSLLAFGGVGATDAGSRRIFKDSGLIAAGGAGFRFRLARKLGLDAGLDLAYGPGGFVFYVQFGHAWMLRMD